MPPRCSLGASWMTHEWFLLHDSFSMISCPWFLHDSFSMISPPWFLLHASSWMTPPQVKSNQSKSIQNKTYPMTWNHMKINSAQHNSNGITTVQNKSNRHGSNQTKSNQIKSNQILSPLSPLLSPLYCLLSDVPTSDVTVIEGRKTLFGVSYWCHFDTV